MSLWAESAILYDKSAYRHPATIKTVSYKATSPLSSSREAQSTEESKREEIESVLSSRPWILHCAFGSVQG